VEGEIFQKVGGSLRQADKNPVCVLKLWVLYSILIWPT